MNNVKKTFVILVTLTLLGSSIASFAMRSEEDNNNVLEKAEQLMNKIMIEIARSRKASIGEMLRKPCSSFLKDDLNSYCVFTDTANSVNNQGVRNKLRTLLLLEIEKEEKKEKEEVVNRRNNSTDGN